VVKELKLHHNQITVIDFYSLYTKCIEASLIKDLSKYSCQSPDVDITAQRLIMHHIIKGVCDYVLNSNSNSKTVVYFCSTELLNTRIFDLYENKKLIKVFTKVSKAIKTKLPIRWYNSTFPINYFEICLYDNKNDGIEIITNIKSICNEDFTKFLFDKIKLYVKKNNLTFLDSTYFNQLRSKMLLLS